MLHALLALAGLAALGSLRAQVPFTSPPGIGSDGDSVVSSLQPFHAATNGRRFQYVVDDVRAVPGQGGASISNLALRPDPAAPQSAARTASVTVVLDHASFPTLTPSFAGNYSGAETTHALGTVSLPQTTGGAGFVVAFTLPAPFVYLGVHNQGQPGRTALLVEFRTTAVAGGTHYSLDCADGTTAPAVGTSTYLGLQPCVVPPNTTGFDIVKHGPTTDGSSTTLGQHAVRGPAASFGILAIGFTDPQTTFGGALCAPLRTSIDVHVNVASDAQGSVGSFANPLHLTFPDLRGSLRARLFTQFVLHDPARAAPQLPVSLSDAIQFDVTAPAPIDRRLIWATSSATATTGTLTPLFVPVLRLQ